MKKIVRTVVLLVLALLLVGYIAVQFFLGSIVKAGVNRAGPRITQSKVELEGASLSPLSGSGTLTGLTVGNPQGWSDTRALYLGKMHFEIEPASLFKDAVVINDFVIEQPEFSYETRLVSSNIGDLMKNIEAAVGGGAEPQAKDPNAKPRKFVIKHFLLQNAKVTVGVGTTAIPLTLPPLELTDLGVKEGGLTAGQLTFAVMKVITPQIISATTQAAGKMGGTMGAAAGEAAKKASEGIQKLFGGKKK